MGKLLQAFVLLNLAVSSTVAQHEHNEASCTLSSAEVVDDMLDAAVYIWAATKRCDPKAPKADADPVRCSLNILASIESVNAMGNVLLKALEKCGALNFEFKRCGMAIGVLTKATAGLGAASAGIVAKCPNSVNHFKPLVTYATTEEAEKYEDVHGRANITVGSSMGECLVDIKDTTKSLFQAIKAVLTLKENCEDPYLSDKMHCAHNSLKVSAAFTAMGGYIAGAVGKCTTNVKTKEHAECAEKSMRLIKEAQDVGRAGIDLAKFCGAEHDEAERLYIERGEGTGMPIAYGSSINAFLTFLLPATAVISFVVGKRVGITRSREEFHYINPEEGDGLE